MLDALEIIKKVTQGCEYPCEAMKKIPKETLDYQTETKPERAGVFFNADVLQESGMKILVLRENLTSFTETMFVKNEQKPTIREALIILTSKLRADQQITIRVDAQSSLKALKLDKILAEEDINLDVGSAKNKNSVAEKAIRELREEIVKLSPHGGKVSETVLAKATRNLNSRIRHTGCSARELWVKRDNNSGQSLQFDDEEISDVQYKMRIKSHEYSARYESRNAPRVVIPDVKIGDRIYIKSDGSKSKARDPYVVLWFVPNKNEIEVQKLLDKNRRNIVRVHLQNVYKIEPNEESTKETDLEYEETDPKDDEDGDHKFPVKLEVFQQIEVEETQTLSDNQCFFCMKMKRKLTNHSYLNCESLLRVRPGLRQCKVTNVKMSETDDDDDDDPEETVKKFPENNLIMFSDDDLDDVVQHEVVVPVQPVVSLLDGSDDDNEMESSTVDENNEDADGEDNNDQTDDGPSPPRPNRVQQVQPNKQLELSVVLEEDSEITDDEGSDDVLRDTVIQHEGECCPTNVSPRTRRLGGRSLPGRSIENRNLSITVPPQPQRQIPGRLALEGDVIRYFTGQLVDGREEWLRATVQRMFLTQQRRYPSWYNIVNEMGVELGLELHVGGSWQLLRGDQWEFVDDGERRPA